MHPVMQHIGVLVILETVYRILPCRLFLAGEKICSFYTSTGLLCPFGGLLSPNNMSSICIVLLYTCSIYFHDSNLLYIYQWTQGFITIYTAISYLASHLVTTNFAVSV